MEDLKKVQVGNFCSTLNTKCKRELCIIAISEDFIFSENEWIKKFICQKP